MLEDNPSTVVLEGVIHDKEPSAFFVSCAPAAASANPIKDNFPSSSVSKTLVFIEIDPPAFFKVPSG
jgi:hypothetical protein